MLYILANVWLSFAMNFFNKKEQQFFLTLFFALWFYRSLNNKIIMIMACACSTLCSCSLKMSQSTLALPQAKVSFIMYVFPLWCHHDKSSAKHLQAGGFFLSLAFWCNFFFSWIHSKPRSFETDQFVEPHNGSTSASEGTTHSSIVVFDLRRAWCNVEATRIGTGW
jgi:hypothetical protein